MGNPQHYGIELPGRCLDLINTLWENAARVRGGDRPDLGPLTSTFLISMSMPMVNLPIERIERHLGLDGAGYADDRHINRRAEQAFNTVIRRGTLQQAPFYRHGDWRFAHTSNEPFPNIADGLPEDIADKLGSDDAVEAARNMPASQWISTLRNALAHGGVAYLDEDGRSRYGRPVKMYAFVSGKYLRPECKYSHGQECPGGMGTLSRLNFLRISEEDYLHFLRAWVSWLEDSKLQTVTAA